MKPHTRLAGKGLDERDAMKKLLKGKKFSSVLDAGCGDGTVSEIVRKENPNAKFLLLDLSDSKIEQARQKGFQAVCQDFWDFETEQKFDLIIMCAFLEHLEDPSGALMKTGEWLVPGGKIVLNFPCADMPFRSVVAWIYRRVKYGRKYAKVIEKEHKQLMSSEEWMNLLDFNGFEIEKVLYGSYHGPSEERQGLKNRILRNSVNILAKKVSRCVNE